MLRPCAAVHREPPKTIFTESFHDTAKTNGWTTTVVEPTCMKMLDTHVSESFHDVDGLSVGVDLKTSNRSWVTDMCAQADMIES